MQNNLKVRQVVQIKRTNKNTNDLFCLTELYLFFRHQSILKSPVGQFGIAAVALISICKFRRIELKSIRIDFIFS
jgi:hypothetical protein